MYCGYEQRGDTCRVRGGCDRYRGSIGLRGVLVVVHKVVLGVAVRARIGLLTLSFFFVGSWYEATLFLSLSLSLVLLSVTAIGGVISAQGGRYQ